MPSALAEVWDETARLRERSPSLSCEISHVPKRLTYAQSRQLLKDAVRVGEKTDRLLRTEKGHLRGEHFLVRAFFAKVVRSGGSAAILTESGRAEDAVGIVRSMWEVNLDIALVLSRPDAFLRYREELDIDLEDMLKSMVITLGGEEKAAAMHPEIVRAWKEHKEIVRQRGLRRYAGSWRSYRRDTKKPLLAQLLDLDGAFVDSDEVFAHVALLVQVAEGEGDAQMHNRPLAINRRIDRKPRREVLQLATTRSSRSFVQIVENVAAFLIAIACDTVVEQYYLEGAKKALGRLKARM